MIWVVDEIMGSGKTNSTIQMINLKKNERYIYVTPYLSEVQRIKDRCSFEEPESRYDKETETVTKIGGMKKLVRKGKNVVTTHALIGNFTEGLLREIKDKDYTLIMDECLEVVKEYDRLSEGDKYILLNYLTDRDEENRLVWRDGKEYKDFYYEPEMRLCKSKQLVMYGNNVLIKMFNIEVLKVFSDVYILTYMFKGQMLRYYLEYYGMEYKYKKIVKKKLVKDIRELINICDDAKLNAIGEESLSMTWYTKNGGKIEILRKNLNTYLRSQQKGKSGECMWTTFMDYQEDLKGYKGDFVPLNKIATNEYRDRTKLAYLVNIYMNPYIKNFFSAYVEKVDEDAYALSILLQWIWRSAIRDGKEINLYLPSKRMRRLLNEWLANLYILK